MVVPRREVDITTQAVFLLADHQSEFDMGFQTFDSVNHVDTGLFQFFTPGDVRGLIKTGGDFHQHHHLLACHRCFFEDLDDGGTTAGAVDRQLQCQHLGVTNGGFKKAEDGGFIIVIGMMQKQICFADFREK